MKRRFYELSAEARWRCLIWTVMLGLTILASMGTGAVTLYLASCPVYAIRTDLEGKSDVIRLYQEEKRRVVEVEEFVKGFGFHAFSWTPQTVVNDREYVESRSSIDVRHRLSKVVPGYELGQKEGKSSPRVSMRLEGMEVRADDTGFRVVVRLAMNFWRTERMPADRGQELADDPGWHRYCVVMHVSLRKRSLVAPEGLVVDDLRRIQLGG